MNKHVLPLSLLVIALAVVGFLLLREPGEVVDSGQHLFASLAKNVAQVDSIRLETAEGLLMQAHQREQGWMIENVAGSGQRYPAAQQALADLVTALMQAQKLEAKTALPENYAKLGVQPLSQADSQAVQVTLEGAGQQWQLLIGKSANSGQYVRKPNEAQSWLVDTGIDVAGDLSDWLAPEVLDFGDDPLQIVRRIDDNPWIIEKGVPEQDNFTLRELPQDRELKYASVLNSVASNIDGFSFEQLMPFEQTAWDAMVPMLELELQTFAGKLYQVAVRTQDEQQYLHIQSDVDGVWQGWLYQISSFTANQLNKTLDDFLNDITPEEPVADVEEGTSPE